MEQQNSPSIQWKQYIGALLKWWWLIMIAGIMAGVIGYIVNRSQPKQYWSAVTLMVGDFRQKNTGVGEISTSIALAQSYADIATREPVLRATLNTLKLPWETSALRAIATARVLPGTQLIQIAVVDAFPERAALLATAMSEQLIQLSPNNDSLTPADRQLIQDQIETLKANLVRANAELKDLDSRVSAAQTAREIQTINSQRSLMQQQMTTWQVTIASLLQQVQSGPVNSLSVIEPAMVPGAPVGPNWPQSVGLSVLVAVLLAVALAMLLEYMDDTIKTQEDARRTLNLAPIGAITRIDNAKGPAKMVAVATAPLSRAAEAYRILRTNLQFKMIERSIRTLMVTSSIPAEGKSVTVSNLASVIAQSGKKVILVDADMRRPTVHRIFDINNNMGLTGALLHPEMDISNFITEDVLDNLSIMPTGELPPNPAELLSSERMNEVIALLRQRAEIVIFDTPPALGVADSTVLAGKVDGVLLVVDSNRTRRATARAAAEALLSVGANMLGVVINRIKPQGADAMYMYYYPPHKDSTKQKSPKRGILRSPSMNSSGIRVGKN
jgi:capsular exopolysaccharide synthesis family protein